MSAPARPLPLRDRLVLGHGVVESAARACGADLLHIKGPAAEARMRAPERVSSDVDVLVRPAHAPRLLQELASRGCELRTGFDSGSHFRHAATLFHPRWSWIDVHRHFPGIGLDPEEAFDLLWCERASVALAGAEVQVPSTLHQALLLVLNAARDSRRREADVHAVRIALEPAEWAQLETSVTRFDAVVAFAAATGHLDDVADHPAHDLWQVMASGGGRWQEWRARWRAAGTVGERMSVLQGFSRVDREWLAAELGRAPTRREVVAAQQRRLRVALSELRRERGHP